MVTIDDVREITAVFPRSYEAAVQLQDLLEDAWRMVVPKSVARDFFGG